VSGSDGRFCPENFDPAQHTTQELEDMLIEDSNSAGGFLSGTILVAIMAEIGNREGVFLPTEEVEADLAHFKESYLGHSEVLETLELTPDMSIIENEKMQSSPAQEEKLRSAKDIPHAGMHRRSGRLVKGIVAAVIVTLALGVLTATGDNSWLLSYLGIDAPDFVVNWIQGGQRPDEEPIILEGGSYKNLSEAFNALYLQLSDAPDMKQVPERFTQDGLVAVNRQLLNNSIEVHYVSDDGGHLSMLFVETQQSNETASIERVEQNLPSPDNANGEKGHAYHWNNQEYIIIFNNNDIRISWNVVRKEYSLRCSIWGTITEAEAIAMIETITN